MSRCARGCDPPDEPEYGAVEKLYIDPEECIDCDACVEACPVDACFAEDQLPDEWQRFTQVNAEYYTPTAESENPGEPDRVFIDGAGTSTPEERERGADEHHGHVPGTPSGTHRQSFERGNLPMPPGRKLGRGRVHGRPPHPNKGGGGQEGNAHA